MTTTFQHRVTRPTREARQVRRRLLELRDFERAEVQGRLRELEAVQVQDRLRVLERDEVVDRRADVTRRLKALEEDAKRFKPKALAVQRSGDTATVRLYGLIGNSGDPEDVGADDLARTLDELRGCREVQLQINSVGGSVFEALAMVSQIRRFPGTVSACVDGLAASAASVVAMAVAPGKLGIAKAGQMMVHRAWAMTVGNRNDHFDQAKTLDKIDGIIAGLYAGRTGRPVSAWLTAMDAETWFTGAEAVRAGLADFVF